MTEEARGRHGAVLDFFDVGGADAAHGDLDEEFVGADAGDGDGFEAEVVHAAIDDGAHGFGYVRHGEILTQRRKDAKAEGGEMTKRMKTENRIPMAERRPKAENRPASRKPFRFELRISDFFRISDLGSRILKSEPPPVVSDKRFEPRFRLAGKFHRLAAPEKAHGAGMQRLVRQNEPGKLLRRQAIFDQRQIQILVATVKFVADDGMAEVGEVNADLMFAAGAGNYSQKRAG
jgi:hypothetical protein